MAPLSRPLLLLVLSALALSSLLLLSSTATTADDEDLAFLESVTDDAASPSDADADADEYPYDEGEDFSEFDGYPDADDVDFEDEGEAGDGPKIDESDVVVLTDRNFSEFVEVRRHVLVEFYAPWCGHCQALAPEFAAAAMELKGEDVALAKVDATEENELAQRFEIQGFPTVLFFVDGVHRDYPGTRRKEGIVSWIKKKIGPGVENITTVEEAEKVLAADSKLVLGFLDSLVGPESHELAAASKLEDGVNFYQTVIPDVAKLFHIDSDIKKPALVLVKNDDEKIAHFEGQFSKSAIADFVFANKLPLVTIFTKESAPELFENPIKKQILLFAVSNDSVKILPAFKEAAKFFKGKLIFVYVEMDNEDVGKPVSEYFGVSGDGPKVLAYTGNEDAKKFILNGEVTVDNVKKFAESFLEDKLKPFYKSDPIPENNDGDVKIVVGDNFDEIVLDESKDVLLEIYAPWCGHCQSLEPIYNKLGKYLRGIESLVIAKMDGTTNEHPRAKTDGFPTILFFPAGIKSFEPITVETERTVVEFYKFLKKHASIPFKLQRPASGKTEATDASSPKTESIPSSDVKDEL